MREHWTGTDDPTPALCVPTAIRVVEALGGGWPAIRERNRALVLEGRTIVCEELGIEPPAPASMIGSLAALPLPDSEGEEPPASALYANALQRTLLEENRIEVPIPPWPAPPKRLVRISAHLYNEVAEYERLASALRALL